VFKGEKRAGDVTIVFIADERMADLNFRFRRKNRTTDVLAFPLTEKSAPNGRVQGEIYISLDQARRQAREYGITLGEELKRLVVHGTLHLLGYDHHRRAEARRMRAKEEQYLSLGTTRRSSGA
jgi:probable rRNA maturation factor